MNRHPVFAFTPVFVLLVFLFPSTETAQRVYRQNTDASDEEASMPLEAGEHIFRFDNDRASLVFDTMTVDLSATKLIPDFTFNDIPAPDSDY
jgi:hypothetical protein